MPLVPASGFIIDTNRTTLTSGTITAVGFNPPGVLWEYELTPNGVAPENTDDRNFRAGHDGPFSFKIEFHNDQGLFPFQFVDYVNDQNPPGTVRVNKLSDVPQSATQIVKSQDDNKDLLTWTLTVTVAGTVGPFFTPSAEVGVFTVRVYANYDVSKEELKGLINARS